MEKIIYLGLAFLAIFLLLRFRKNIFSTGTSCTNCGRSVHKEKQGVAEIHELNLCEDCLGNPQNINSSHVLDNLQKLQWSKEDIHRAYSALEKYKEFYKASPS